MDMLYPHCAGLAVHKKTVMVGCIVPGADGTPQRLRRTCSTMTHDLLLLADWLTALGVTHVALEATGEFWKSVSNILESSFTLLVVNARHSKHVPGRTTDVKDAEWIAELLRHGLLRPSFIPPLPQRDLRDLTRQRTNLVQDRATVVLRLQKVLEWANLKLTSVVTAITGVSARAMLEGIIEGEGDGAVLAELAHGRMRSKRAALEQALTGRVREQHRYLLAQHLIHMDFLDEQIEDLEAQIGQMIAHESGQDSSPPHAAAGEAAAASAEPLDASGEDGAAGAAVPWADAVELLDTIPGVGRTAAEQIIAEIGTDMGRFRSAAHLASWARMCPGNNERAGKRFSGKCQSSAYTASRSSAIVHRSSAMVHRSPAIVHTTRLLLSSRLCFWLSALRVIARRSYGWSENRFDGPSSSIVLQEMFRTHFTNRHGMQYPQQ
jgi:transposase